MDIDSKPAFKTARLVGFDNGYCRVYYRIGRTPMCLQVEDNAGNIVVLYDCHDDEPGWSHKTDGVKFEVPKGDSLVERQVRDFIVRHGLGLPTDG
jgi:hypothetical protein